MCHIGLLLGLIDVVQCLHKLRTLASYKQSVTRKLNKRILLFQTERASFAETCTSINQPYFIWTAVICHVPPPKDQGDWDPQSKCKSKHFMLKDSGRKVNRPRAALGFTPSHEVLQKLSGVEHCRPISDDD